MQNIKEVTNTTTFYFERLRGLCGTKRRIQQEEPLEFRGLPLRRCPLTFEPGLEFGLNHAITHTLKALTVLGCKKEALEIIVFNGKAINF